MASSADAFADWKDEPTSSLESALICAHAQKCKLETLMDFHSQGYESTADHHASAVEGIAKMEAVLECKRVVGLRRELGQCAGPGGEYLEHEQIGRFGNKQTGDTYCCQRCMLQDQPDKPHGRECKKIDCMTYPWLV